MDDEEEEEFLRKLSDLVAGAALLSASLRWGIEGVLKNQQDLPALAVRLQEIAEKSISLVEQRRRRLRKSSA